MEKGQKLDSFLRVGICRLPPLSSPLFLEVSKGKHLSSAAHAPCRLKGQAANQLTASQDKEYHMRTVSHRNISCFSPTQSIPWNSWINSVHWETFVLFESTWKGILRTFWSFLLDFYFSSLLMEGSRVYRYTLIPTSVILGLGGAPLWSAKCTYLTIAGNSYAEKAGKIGKDIINQYFGVFFLIFQSSGIWGNLISSLILSQSSNKVEISEDHLACCGAYDCESNTTNTTALAEPSKSLVYTLLGVYTATAMNTACIIALLLWKPHSNQLVVFFIFPALWGLSDAIWQTQTNGLYGVLFEKHTEAAFANYRLWESCGFVIAFGYSTTLRVYIKLYILLAVLMLSMVTYGMVEYLEAKRSSGTPATTEKENKGPHTQETHI
ncbi:protein unc-93 homolog A isoform X4 [Centrocercus urophasianus]|uniref:protein unc-93 homolog A isoform X4 n=1 Tax=Centrocercus urophasianus TaxID=9002 RepID=UPI001C64E368|nr:protein unc-93 homolog A isoform X4 [Centrocercus urophasianus]